MLSFSGHLAGVRTYRSDRNTSPLYSFSFRANDDDYDRHQTTTLHCNIAAFHSALCFLPCLLHLSYMHTTEHLFDDERS
jgi:hypothetical protein